MVFQLHGQIVVQIAFATNKLTQMGSLHTYLLCKVLLLDTTFPQLFTQDFSWVDCPNRN